MRTKQLGSAGPELSVIGYGAWEAGGDDWGANESDSSVIEAIHAAMDAGINWIDTAEVYGGGESERLVGLAVAGRRDDVLVASKVAPADAGSGFRAEEVAAACDASLQRMRIDVIDLYQLHWPDATGVPVEDTWAAMASLADAGKVRFIGVSNFDRALIERCEAIRRVDSLQQEFSMLHLDDQALIRWCGERGIGVLSYSPLGVGMLTGRFTRESAAAVQDWRRGDEGGVFAPENLDRNLSVVESLRPIAERLGCTIAQLALAWNWHQPGVTSAIAGSRTPTHVRENAAAGDLELDDATLAEIDQVLN
jgi:aryl-alcohol dehydrogenase-like predicted oxidoreductase